MTHFPYLEKQFIRKSLNPYCVSQQIGWKKHLNSQIIQKYIEIKQKQKQKIDKILPQYYIFPKDSNQNNFYTHIYDLDRLQRLKNASNIKYKTKQLQYTQKSVVNIKSQLNLSKTQNRKKSSRIKDFQRRPQQLGNDSGKKYYHSKSTKSLTQTNISPSKLSKPFKHPNIQKIYYNESDSEIFQQNFHRQNDTKTSKQGNIKDNQNFCRKDSQKIYKNIKVFKNIESTLTVPRKRRPDQLSQYQNIQKSAAESDKKLTKKHIHFKASKNHQMYPIQRNQQQICKVNNNRNKKSKDCFKFNNQEANQLKKEIFLFDKNKDQITNFSNKFQQSRNFQLQNNKKHQKNKDQYIKISGKPNNQLERYDGQADKLNNLNKKITNRNSNSKQNFIERNNNQFREQNGKILKNAYNNPQRATEYDIQGQVYQSQILNENIKNGVSEHQKYRQKGEYQQNSNYSQKQVRNEKSYYKQQNINLKNFTNDEYYTNQVTFQNILTNKKSGQIDIKSPSSKFQQSQPYKKGQIQQKLKQYYGQQFQRVKEQRDYLRRHFILHLQNKHTKQLPYKGYLKQIEANYQTKKIILKRQDISCEKQHRKKDKVLQVDMKY